MTLQTQATTSTGTGTPPGGEQTATAAGTAQAPAAGAATPGATGIQPADLRQRLGDPVERRTRAEAQAAERKAQADELAELRKTVADMAAREAARDAAAQKAASDSAVDALLVEAKVKPAYREYARGKLGALDPTKPESKAKVDEWCKAHPDLVESTKLGPLTPPSPNPERPKDGRPRGADFMPKDLAASRARNGR